MKKIQMVDLQSQYRRLKPEIDKALLDATESARFINGPDVKAFADELGNWLGGAHVIPCANGTDALQIGLMAMDLQPGDEVITSNFTFISTVEVLVLLKLKPVLVDVDPVTFNLDPEAVRKAITPKTRVIVPVHLFGQPADMDPILDLAREHGLQVMEDNAQSLGSSYTHRDGSKTPAGLMGHISTTSFFPTKPLGCYGDGGALITRDEQLADQVRTITNHGARVKYYHERIGVNSRLDTLQAAILRVNLHHLDHFISARQKVAAYYNLAFEPHPSLQTPATAPNATHVFHQYTLVIRKGDRNQLREKLKDLDIPSMVYYPVPLSLQEAFRSAGYQKGDFPVTEQLCEQVLSLPIHTEMEAEQMAYITSNLLKLLD